MVPQCEGEEATSWRRLPVCDFMNQCPVIVKKHDRWIQVSNFIFTQEKNGVKKDEKNAE